MVKSTLAYRWRCPLAPLHIIIQSSSTPPSFSRAIVARSRIKIVVTQNFNKSQPFGLAFIKFHSPPENTGEAKQEGKKFGMFTIKDEGSSSPKPIKVQFARISFRIFISSADVSSYFW